MEPIIVHIEADLEELIPSFLKNRHKDVQKLYELVGQQEMKEAARLGHSLKGVGGGFGFDAISEFGRAIEEAAENSQIDELCRLTEEFKSFLEHVQIVYDG